MHLYRVYLQNVAVNNSLPTDTMNKQLWFRREVEVDNDVEHWNVDATCRQVCHDENARHLITKLCDSDFACRRIQGAVGI